MPGAARTKGDLQDEVAELRAKLRDAQSIIAEALGEPDEDDDADEDDADEYDYDDNTK